MRGCNGIDIVSDGTLNGSTSVHARAQCRGMLLARQRRNYAAHGAWVMRGYALGIGAGTQTLTHLPWFVLMGTPGETSRVECAASQIEAAGVQHV